MNATVDVPRDIHSRLLGSFAAHSADEIIRDGGRRGDVMIGDGPGEVLAWLLQTDPDRSMLVLADLMAQLRVHHSDAPDPQIRLADVLDALSFAFPTDFSDADKKAFTTAARTRVSGFYGGDPDE